MPNTNERDALTADITTSARVVELNYETNRAVVRFEGFPPEIGNDVVFLPCSTAEPMARVNDEGFLVECGDLPLSPGMLLYAAPNAGAPLAGVCEPPDEAELESWRAAADNLLRSIGSPNSHDIRSAAFLLQNAYSFASKLAAAPAQQAGIGVEPMGAEEWRELYRLREAVKGPDGYATWQDAATAERVRRVKAERNLAAAQQAGAPLAPVEACALEASILELDAWEARADGQELTTAESESVVLVLHELKRLCAASRAPLPLAPSDPDEAREELDAVIACLGDDAASLREDNPEDERAANMDRAAELLGLLATRAQPQADAAEPSQYQRMFEAACVDLGLINEALGLDPDDGGAEPILDAIAELMGLKAVVSVPRSGEMVLVSRDLLCAACSAIDKKRGAPTVLAKLRAIALTAPSHAGVDAAEPVAKDDAQIWDAWRRSCNAEIDTGDIRRTDIVAFGRVLMAPAPIEAQAPGARGGA